MWPDVLTHGSIYRIWRDKTKTKINSWRNLLYGSRVNTAMCDVTSSYCCQYVPGGENIIAVQAACFDIHLAFDANCHVHLDRSRRLVILITSDGGLLLARAL